MFMAMSSVSAGCKFMVRILVRFGAVARVRVWFSI
jgi:hypothetical protein